MAKLSKKDIEILEELQDEIKADIEMLEEYFGQIEELLKKDNIQENELGDDI